MSKYCEECGNKLIIKYLDNEGDIPYCPSCKAYRFPKYNVAVSMIVINKTNNKILLIKQYGNDFCVLVAGYVNKGEKAEEAVIREIKEETGMDVVDYKFNRTSYYERTNTLMLNFTVYVDSDKALNPNKEIDSYKWFDFKEAQLNIKENSLAKEFLCKFLEDK